jgi:lipopolysaccharide transport system permease protein
MMVWYGFAPRVIGVALLPVLVITAFLSSLGLGMFMASLNIKYRDVRYALPFIVQILMYVTPVIYPVRMLDKYPVAKTLMLWANPMSGVISNARAALLGRSAIDWGAIGISLLMGTLFFAAGLWYFRATERYFADVV